MRLTRLWAMFKARNLEFFRDHSAFGWNFLFPFLIVGGFGIIFGGKGYTEFKVGLFPMETRNVSVDTSRKTRPFLDMKHVEFIPFKTKDKGLDRLKHHKIDLLIQLDSPTHRYWINDASPKGYIVEKVFLSTLLSEEIKNLAEKNEITGHQIRYIDWLFPGILAMNMMFSALWGVGYIVVRYRKNGVLKRLKATPLSAFEYLAAQGLSRIFLLMFTLIVVWIGCDLVFSFRVVGRYLDLLLIFFVGGLSLSAMGLLVASRGTSEELTNGILNFITWPMMFLSEVWFSIESAPTWVKTVAKLFPLTHMLSAARKVMNDGAGLLDIGFEVAILMSMTLACLGIGAILFSWNR